MSQTEQRRDTTRTGGTGATMAPRDLTTFKGRCDFAAKAS
jgi:hypothetical protein